MNFAFDEDQRLIRQSADELVRRLAPMARVRELIDDDATAYCAELWNGLADAGFLGTLIPGPYGGAELGFVDMGCVLEALGGALASGPYIASAVVAADAIKNLASDEQCERWLPRIASGNMVACPAICHSEPQTCIESVGNAFRVNGRFAPVAFAGSADLLLVEAFDPNDNACFFLPIEPTADGVAIVDIGRLDPTRRFSAIELTDVEISLSDRLPTPIDDNQSSRLVSVGAAATAADMLGGATKAHEMASAYAKERHQFGKPIGSFQAIKHILADQLVALEGARSAVYAALWTLDNEPTAATVAAAVAKTAMTDVHLKIASENIQIHGGMGFTAEVDAHLYLRRAQFDEIAYGAIDHHLEMLAERLPDLA